MLPDSRRTKHGSSAFSPTPHCLTLNYASLRLSVPIIISIAPSVNSVNCSNILLNRSRSWEALKFLASQAELKVGWRYLNGGSLVNDFTIYLWGQY